LTTNDRSSVVCGSAHGHVVCDRGDRYFTPLRWEEVSEDLAPLSFTMPVVLERIRKHGDLYAGVLTTRQRLTDALKALGG
jgi:DNA primase